MTRADYAKLPEGEPIQLVEGEFVREATPIYQHQRVLLRATYELVDLVGQERVVPSPVDVVIDEFNVYWPDVAVYAAPLAAHQKDLGVPILVIEVLSPSTATRDRKRKTRHYLAAGVREVWLVEPTMGAIEIHTEDGVRVLAPDDAAVSQAVPGFSVTGRALVR